MTGPVWMRRRSHILIPLSLLPDDNRAIVSVPAIPTASSNPEIIRAIGPSKVAQIKKSANFNRARNQTSDPLTLPT